MDRRTILWKGAVLVAGAALPALAARREPVLGGPCEGCEWVFDGMPRSPGSQARIAPAGEPGVPLIIDGRVTTSRGSPAAGVVIYAYHTDLRGIYPPGANRHGSLRAWVRTDAQGNYRFDTIRPGAYPSRDVAEHVHLHVIEPGVGTYYIDNLEFADEPLNTRRPGAGRGGQGLIQPTRRDDVWHARRDIVLGRNIPGYPTSPT